MTRSPLESFSPGIHDLIVGDFGRVATLRYLEVFSRIEREFIAERLGSHPFFDEYRGVSYTVVGLLRQMKQPELADFIERGSPLDRSILAGVAGGITPEEIGRRMLEVLTSWIHPILELDRERVRIIIPCNTLSDAGSVIRAALNHMKGQPNASRSTRPEFHPFSGIKDPEVDRIKVYTIPEIVVEEVARLHSNRVRIIGTGRALRAYEEAVEKRGLNVEVHAWTGEHGESSDDVIMAHVRGEKDVVPPIEQSSDEITVSACTDVEISGTLDSLTVFARYMVEQAYREHA